MRYVQAAVGVTAALVFMGASAAMNWVFLSSLGHSPLEAQIFGALSVAVDVLKSFLPLYIAAAFAAGRRLFCAFGLLMFAVLFAFSSISAIGFVAGNRGAVTGGKQDIVARHDTALKDQGAVEARLKGLPAARPNAVIAEVLNGLEQDRRWSSSRRCSEATAADSRAFCEGYFAAKAELAAAVERQRLEQRLVEVRAEVARLRAAGGALDVDAQASLFARFTGWGVSGTQQALALFIAMVVELGAAFGLYLAIGWLPKRAPARAHADPRPMPAASRMPQAPAMAAAMSPPRPAKVVEAEAVEIDDPDYWNAPVKRLQLQGAS